MNYSYFPGCTLYTKAKTFDMAGRKAFKELGFELEELENWTCCGATFPLAEDNNMVLSSPARALADTKNMGRDKLVTACAICHNVLKRTNNVMQKNELRRGRVNTFIERDYDGSVEVVHQLELLRDEVGFDALAAKVQKGLNGLKVGAFYGCLLLRPAGEMKMDDPDNPSIFEKLLTALGASTVDYPMKAECCGAFQVVNSEETASRCSREIIDSARKRGVEMLITACPLCQFNLEDRQREMVKADSSFKTIPVMYFTELLALALGLGIAIDPEKHYVDPRPVLARYGLEPQVEGGAK